MDDTHGNFCDICEWQNEAKQLVQEYNKAIVRTLNKSPPDRCLQIPRY